MEALLYKRPDEQWYELGGMTLIERNLRLLEKAGVTTARILAYPGDALPPLSVPRPLSIERHLVNVAFPTGDPLGALGHPALEIEGPFFYLPANLLVDPRILVALQGHPAPVWWAGSPQRATDDERIGWLERTQIAGEGPEAVSTVGVADVSHYNDAVRGDVVPYCELIADAASRERGWHALIRGAHKQPGDFIEKFIQPGIERWIVRHVATTPVTPNQITILSILIAAVAAVLFYRGQFYAGCLLAFVTIVLDGVDGKLARVKLMTSRFGELEHVFDYFYENAWWLSLAGGFAMTQGPGAWTIGIALTALDTVDNVLGMLFGKVTGTTLDEMSPFDASFRLIGGRRGIYLSILLAGHLAGAAYLSFQIVLAWAAFTVVVHAIRFAYHRSRGRATDTA